MEKFLHWISLTRLLLLALAVAVGLLPVVTPAVATAAAVGRYRVVINGFDVTAETWDDALEWDGKHDEVFVAAKVVVMNSAGQELYESQPRSLTMGDINNQNNRVQAGTASPLGGLRTGDAFPTGTPWIQATPPSPTRNSPPLKIWEGDLVQGDTVATITPGIFEEDSGGTDLYTAWTQWANNLYTKLRPKLADLLGPTSSVLKVTDIGLDIFVGLTEITGINGTRPIGMHKPEGATTYQYDPPVLKLTYDTAEYIINSEPAGHGRGVLAFTYQDDPALRGNYILYVQVERVAPTSVHFSGASQYVQVPSGPSLVIPNNDPFTIETWVNVDNFNSFYQTLVDKGNKYSGPGYGLSLEDHHLILQYGVAGAHTTGSSNLTPGIWYHVAGVYDGSGGKIYVNGVLDGTLARPTTNTADTMLSLKLGATGQGTDTPSLYWLAGRMDEVRIWRVARTQAEIQNAMNTRLTGSEPGLAAYWRLDEGSGVTTLDSSPNRNTGTLINGPTWVPSTIPG